MIKRIGTANSLRIAFGVPTLLLLAATDAYVRFFMDIPDWPARARFIEVADAVCLSAASGIIGFMLVCVAVALRRTYDRILVAVLGANIIVGGNYPLFVTPMALERDVVHARTFAETYSVLVRAFAPKALTSADPADAVAAAARQVSSVGQAAP